MDGDVPPVHDAHGEEGREEDDAVDPLRAAARVSRLVEEPGRRAGARVGIRTALEAIIAGRVSMWQQGV